MPAERWAVWHKGPERLPIAGQQPVARINGRREAEHAADLSKKSGARQLEQQLEATALVARERRAIRHYQPPTLAPAVLWDSGEQANGLLISEGQERQPILLIEAGDHPGRPGTGASARSVQQHRADDALPGR